MIPDLLVDWLKAHVESPLVFLLLLNVFLLLVGCLMDIFSAIVVVVRVLRRRTALPIDFDDDADLSQATD